MFLLLTDSQNQNQPLVINTETVKNWHPDPNGTRFIFLESIGNSVVVKEKFDDINNALKVTHILSGGVSKVGHGVSSGATNKGGNPVRA